MSIPPDRIRAYILGDVESLTPEATPNRQDRLAAFIRGDVDDWRVEAEAEEPGVVGEVGTGVGRGVQATAGLFAGAAGQVAKAAGLEHVGEAGMEAFDHYMAQAEGRPAAVGRIEDIDNVGDFALWAAGVLGENLPTIASVLATGGIGALATKAGIKYGAKELTEKQAKKIVERGAVGGIFAGSAALGTGEVAGELRDVGAEHPLLSLGAGGVIGALDAMPVMTVIKAFRPDMAGKFTTNFLRRLTGAGRGKRALAVGGMVSAQEAGTEALQELVVLAARDLVDENHEILGPEGASRILNAAAAGALVGGGMGAVGGALAPPQEMEGDQGNLLESLATPEAVPAQVAESKIPEFGQVAESRLRKERAARDLIQNFGVPYYAETQVRADVEGGVVGERVESGVTTPEGLFVIPVEDQVWAEAKEIARRDREIVRAERAAASPALDAAEEATGIDRRRLSEGEQKRLARLVARESEGRLTEKETTVLNRLLEKASGEDEAVAGWYAEDDRGTLYGPFKRARAKELSKAFGGTELEIESLGERQRMERVGEVVFQGAEDAEALEEAIKANRSPGGFTGRTLEQSEAWAREVEGIVDDFRRAYPNAPNIAVINPEVSPQPEMGAVVQLESRLGRDHPFMRDRADLQARQDLGALLVASNGVQHWDMGVVINSDGHPNRNAVLSTLAHEVFVHDGLRRFLSSSEHRAVLDIVRRDVDLDYVAQRWGLDLSRFDDEMRAAEEYIARLAEHPENLSSWQKIVAIVRRALRRVMPSLRVTDEEIRLMLMDLGKRYRDPVFGQNRYQQLRGPFAAKNALDKEFASWFKGSEVVNNDGSPRILWYTEGNRPGEFFDRPVGSHALPVHVKADKVLDLSNPVHERMLRQWREKNPDSPGMGREVLDGLGFDAFRLEPELYGRDGLWVPDLKRVRNALGYKDSWTRWDDAILSDMDAHTESVHRVMRSVAVDPEVVRKEEVLRNIQSVSNVWKARAMMAAMNPLQLAGKLPIQPVKDYLAEVERMWNTKIQWLNVAHEVTTEWNKLGKDQGNRLAKVLFELNDLSNEKARRVTDAEALAVFRKHGLDERGQEVWRQVDEAFRSVLPRLERGLVTTAVREEMGRRPMREFVDWIMTEAGTGTQLARELHARPEFADRAAEPLPLAIRIDGIRSQMAALRDRNYFPQERFGRFAIAVNNATDKKVRVDGRTVQPGGLMWFETVESRKAQLERFEELKAEFKGQRVQMGKLQDEEFTFLGFPPELMEQLMTHTGLKLSDKQKAALREIFVSMSPGKRFERKLKKRKGIGGYSHDAQRVFASYMMNGANHLARVEHYQELQGQLEKMGQLARMVDPETGDLLPGEPRDATGMGEVRDYFQRHFEHLMSPGSEWAQVRALGFLWYLGFNAKSAVVNLTQVPMVTYPYLASRFGDGKAVQAIGKAYKDVSSMYTKSPKIERPLSEALQRATNEGFVDESLATDLAAIAEAPMLAKMMPGETGVEMLNKTSYYGAWLFHTAEKYNRRVAFVSAWRLEFERTGDREAAFQAGKASVQKTQYEYAKWNRMAWARGRKSVLFLFWQYMQNTAYLAFGGEGAGTAIRLWLMLGAMAGMQGLPFAENIMDLFDFAAEKFKKVTGWGDPRSDVRTDIRQLAQELGANPDFIMHGMSRYWGLGPVHLLSALGAPIPNVDISGSLSAGRVIPGLEQIQGGERDPDKRLARTIVEVGGPVMGIGYNFWRAMFEQHPDKWKPWERALPTAMKNFSKGMRILAGEGEERLRSGAVIHDYHDVPSRAEAITTGLLKAASFGPTEVARKYERRAAQEEMRRYYLTRRGLVLQNFGYATLLKDREGVAAARKAMRRYNASVPHPALRVTREDLRRSLKARRRAVRLAERGVPQEKRFRQIYSQVGEAY